MTIMDEATRQFIRENNQEREKIFDTLKALEEKLILSVTVTNFTKWVAAIFLSVIVILLSIIAGFSGMDKVYSNELLKAQKNNLILNHRYNNSLDSIRSDMNTFFEDEYYPRKQEQTDVHEKEIIPNTERSKKNEKDIKEIENKIGLY